MQNYLVHRLKEHLALVELVDYHAKTEALNNEKRYDSRKYYDQAYQFLKIGSLHTVPDFRVSLSDLSPKLVKELGQIVKGDRDFILKQAVSRIFEDINVKLYHESISKYLKIRMVR